ncbi:MAG: hypothetical protein HY240_09470 [Actinobacteria bacterium]|nr:hypothetical protein [Actinomycetota bacterium]
MSDVVLPVVVLAEASQEEAEAASALLRAAGGTATVEDVWTTRERAPDIRARPECPSCGSAHVQPFTHAGPAARVNMKCRNCGHLFRSSVARR